MGNPLILGALIASGVILLVGAFVMPAKTLKGVHVKEHMHGLKDYINVAEKDRIAFHDAPEKSSELFQALLPYAIVFGLEKKWAKEFENIHMEDPAWYSGGSYGTFSPTSFVSDMRSFSTFMSSSSGASGGGGVSGGGGGGGGGGSW